MTFDMSPLITSCADYVMEISRSRNVDTTVRGCWQIRYALGLYDVSFTVPREFALIQTSGFGSCHFEGSAGVANLAKIVGASALELGEYPLAYQIAGYDAVASSFGDEHTKTVKLVGTNDHKTLERARIIYEVTKEVGDNLALERRRQNVTMIGALGNVLGMLAGDGRFSVTAIDRNPLVIGKLHHGIRVKDSDCLYEAIASSDIVLLTGMSLGVDGVDDIFNAARLAGAKLIMYMQTGAHLARPVLNYGADVVVSEEYPFYFMGPGESVMTVRHRNQPGGE